MPEEWSCAVHGWEGEPGPATEAMGAALEGGQLVLEVNAKVVFEGSGSDDPIRHDARGEHPVTFALVKGRFERVR